MGIPAAILSSDGRGWAIVSPPVSVLSLSLTLTIFPLHRLIVLTSLRGTHRSSHSWWTPFAFFVGFVQVGVHHSIPNILGRLVLLSLELQLSKPSLSLFFRH